MAVGDSTSSGADSIRELMWVERPAGTHLGPSSDSDALSPLARDDESNAIATHVKLHAAENDDHNSEGGSNVRSAAMGAVATVGAILIVKKVAPPARRAWAQRTTPALRSTWGIVTGTHSRGRAHLLQQPPELVVTAADVIEDGRTAMSTAEARERLAAALLARAFGDEQLRLLRAARIVDGPDPADVERALQSRTPQQLEQGSRLLLESGSLEELRLLLGVGDPEAELLPRQLNDGLS